MNNAVFGKTVGNLRKQRDIELAKKEWRRKYLVSESNYNYKLQSFSQKSY